MATNAIKYISNVGRSLRYSAIDQIKDMSPAVSSFKETNADSLKSAYHAITHLKSTIKTQSVKIMENEYTKVGVKAFNNMWEDIQTGKFYNKERQTQAEDASTRKIFGMDDFDEDFEIDESSFSFGDDDESVDMMDMMDTVGEKSSTAVSMAIARSSEYIVNSNAEMNKAAYEQNKAIFSNIHAAMGTINDNIGQLVKFASGPIQTHIENSTEFFKNETTLSQERNEILKEMLELQKERYKPQQQRSSKNNKISMGDIIDSDGLPDIAQYFKRVRGNIKSSSSENLDMISMLMDNGMLETLFASPLKGITDAVAKKMIPKLIDESMKSFDETLKGVFASSIAKINNMDADTPLKDFIKNALGVNDSVKRSINTSNYDKGPVPFDGITKKSIVEVIPTYLAQISSALTGEDQTRYDFNTGKFVKTRNIKKIYKNIEKDASRSASMDINSFFSDFKQQLAFENKKEQKQFEKDLEAILDKSYRDGMLFNSTDRGRGAKSYGLKGGKKSDVNLQIIRSFFDKLPNGVKMQWANSMFEAKESQTKEMESLEDSGSGLITALFNESIKAASKIGKKSDAAPGKNGNVSGTLNSILEEVRLIREGLGKPPSGRSAGKQNKNSKKTDKKFYQNISNSSTSYSDMSIDNAYSKMNYSLNRIHEEDEQKKTLFDEVMEADTLSDQLKALYSGLDDVITKPVKLLGGLIKKADMSMYNMIFGDIDAKNAKRTEFEEKGIRGVMIEGLQDTFGKFSTWMKSEIILPLARLINGDIIKKAYYDITEALGIDPIASVKRGAQKIFGRKNAEGEWESNGIIGGGLRRFGSTFKRAGSSIKSTASEVGDDFGLTKKLNKTGEDKQSQNSQVTRWLSQLTKTDSGVGEIENAASGMKRVKKTGVVAVSEGEMIVPADLNPFNIQRNLNKENKAKQRFMNSTGYDNTIPSYAEGNIDRFINIDQILENLKSGDPERLRLAQNAMNRVINQLKNVSPEKVKELKEKLKESYQKKNKYDYEEGRDKNIFGKSFNKFKEAGSAIKDGLEDIIPNKEKLNKEKKVLLNGAFAELKDYAPEVAAGAVMGGGISLVTGMIGGPLLGAAVGGGISLIKHSEKVQKMLFGDDDQKGLLSENLSNSIKKYIPAMGKGAIAGAITSLMPFIPGGPVAGIIVGSALGFASQNEELQKNLFGDEADLGKIKDYIVEKLPSMGAGAIAGLIAGPFGLPTNLIVGSAIGYASSTNKFKNMMFGYTDDDGNEHDGLLKGAYENLLSPVLNYAKETSESLKDWSKKYIMNPLKEAADPMKKQMQLMFTSIGTGIKNTLDKIFNERFGAPFDKFMKDRVFGPVSTFIKKFIGGALSPIKGLVSLPFKAVGAVGDHYRTKHVQSGDATYMNASQRMAYRNKKGVGITGRRWKGGESGRFTSYDQALINMKENPDELLDLSNTLKGITNAGDAFDYSTGEAYKDFNKNVRHNKELSAQDINKIGKQMKKLVKGKDADKASKAINNYIAKLDISDEARDQVAKSANNYVSTVAGYRDNQGERDKVKGDLFEKIKKEFGIDLKEEDVSKLNKLVNKDLLDIDKKNKDKAPEEVLKDNHRDTIVHIKSIESLLHTLIQVSGPNPEAANEYFKKYQQDYKQKAGTASGQKEFDKKIDEIKSEDNERRRNNKLGKKLIKNGKNQGLWNKIFGNDSIDYMDGDDYDLSGAQKDLDVDGIEVETGLQSLRSSIKSKMDIKKLKDKKAHYTFVEGEPIKFVSNNQGELVHDTSDAATVETLKKIEKDKTEKTGFFTNISEFAKGLFGKKKRKDNDDEDDDKKKGGIFNWIKNLVTGGGGGSKLATGATVAGLTFGLPVLVGWWTKTAWPMLKDHFGPLVTSIGDKVKEGITSLWDKAVNWFTGGGGDNKEGDITKGLPGLLGRTSKYWIAGVEVLMTKVIPKLAEVVIGCLPQTLIGLGKAIIAGSQVSLKSILNGGRESTNPDQLVKEYMPYDSSIQDTMKIESKNKSLADIVMKGVDLSAWNTGKLNSGNDKSTNLDSNRVNTEDKNGNVLVSGENRIKGNSDTNERNMTTATKGSHKYNYNKTREYTLPDGTILTTDELLNSDKIVGYALDENGNQIPVKGTELLNYPEVAAALGITTESLSASELKANATKMGLDKDTSIAGAIGTSAVKGLVRGSTLPGKFIKGIGKVVSKVPIIGKIPGAPLNGVGAVVEGLGRFGAEMMPSALTGSPSSKMIVNAAGEKVVKEGAEATVSKTAKKAGFEVLEGGLKEGAETTAEKVIQKGTGKAAGAALAKETNEGLLKRIVSRLRDGLKALFNTKGFKKSLSEAATSSGKSGKKLAKEATEKMASEICEKVTESVAKKLPGAIASKAGKVAGALATAGMLNIAFALTAFINGCKIHNTATLIGVSYDSELVTPPVRLMSGLASAINEFFILGLLPLSTIFDILYPILASLFKLDTKELDEERSAVTDQITKINEKYGTDLDVDEYNEARKNDESWFNNNDTWTGIFGKGASIDEEGNYTKGKDGLVQKGVKSIKKGANNAKNFLFGNKETGERNIFGKAGKALIDGRAHLDKAKETINKDVSEVFRKFVSDGKSALTFISKAVPESTKLAEKGDLSGYFDFNGGGKDKSSFDWIKTAGTTITRLLMVVPNIDNYIGGVVGRAIGKIIEGGKTLIPAIFKDIDTVNNFKNKKSLDNYWTIPKAPEGFFGGIQKFIGGLVRALKFPFVVIDQSINKIMDSDLVKGIKEAGNKIKDFLGLDGTKDTKSPTPNNTRDSKGRKVPPRVGGYSGIAGRATGLSFSQIQKEIKDGTFISQLDPKYANKKFNTTGDTQNQTIGDTGCGPAAAAMVLNSYKRNNNEKVNLFQTASQALPYKQQNDGVSADYFGDTFAKNGLSTKYITDSNTQKRTTNIASNLYNGNKVVLMGEDPSNKSKKNSPFGPNTHYVVATRMSKDGKYVYVNDPESSRPEIPYPAASVLNKASMGIAATAASGSGLLNRFRKSARGSGLSNKMRRIMKHHTGRATGSVQEQVWSGLLGGGLSEIQAAGIMGNIEAESGFDPNVIEGGTGVGFGLCQWSKGRRVAIENYAASIGKPAGDIDLQIEFLLAELNPSGGCNGYATYAMMGSSYEGTSWSPSQWDGVSDIDTATKVFCYCWERPHASYTHMDRRLEAANRYYEEFTGTAPRSLGSSSDSGDSSSSSSNSVLDNILGGFDKLASAYGLSSLGSSSSDESNGSTGSAGTVDQNGLVEKMKSIQGTLEYGQANSMFPKPRDAEGGIASDCSETVQWAYKKVLGVDPGGWTGAQETDDDLYTVTDNINDPNKLQPGDLVLYRDSNGGSQHVEMYAGNNELIGHGDPNGMGPTIKPLSTDFSPNHPAMVRRWTGFKDAASGSGLHTGMGSKFLSQSQMKQIKDPNLQYDIRKRKPKFEQDLEFWNNKANREVSTYVARGNAPGNDSNTNISSSRSSMSNILSDIVSTREPKVDNTMQGLVAIIKLLSRVVTNTSTLQTMVSILSELLQIISEQGKLSKENTDSQQAQMLQTRKESLLTALKTTGSSSTKEDNQIAQLINNVEKLASM